MTGVVAVALSVAAAVGAVAITALAMLFEGRRRREAGLKVEPRSSTHHVRVEINGTVFEVNSSTRLTKDEVATLIETAVAAEDRDPQGEPQVQP